MTSATRRPKPPEGFESWLEYAILTFDGHTAALSFMFDAEPSITISSKPWCLKSSMPSGHEHRFRRSPPNRGEIDKWNVRDVEAVPARNSSGNAPVLLSARHGIPLPRSQLRATC